MASIGEMADFGRRHAVDVMIACAFLFLSGAFSYGRSSLLGDDFLTQPVFQDSWFDSDVDAYFVTAGARTSPQHARTGKHPLFSLALYLPVRVLRFAGIEIATATRLYIAAVAGLWAAMFYVFLRMLGCMRTDAVLFTLIALASAAAVFGFVGPETYPFGALGVLMAAMITQVAPRRRIPVWWFAVVNAFTFGITVTDWMAGILATILSNSRKRLLPIFASAAVLVLVLAFLQKLIFPTAVFPPLNVGESGLKSEEKYLFSPDAGSPENIVVSFFLIPS